MENWYRSISMPWMTRTFWFWYDFVSCLWGNKMLSPKANKGKPIYLFRCAVSLRWIYYWIFAEACQASNEIIEHWVWHNQNALHLLVACHENQKQPKWQVDVPFQSLPIPVQCYVCVCFFFCSGGVVGWEYCVNQLLFTWAMCSTNTFRLYFVSFRWLFLCVLWVNLNTIPIFF